MSGMAAARISGTLAAAVTPLRDGGVRLDEDAFGPLLEFWSGAGLDGLLMLGTTGEGIMLAREERRRVAELTMAGAGDLRVIVHCGAQTTADTTALAAHAAEVGADGVAVISPPYYAFSEEELVEHFAAAAAACAPLPFYLYEFADRSGYAMPVAVVERLRERASNLTGMKITDAPFDRVEPYLATGLDIFIGTENLIPDGLERGSVGAMSGVAAVFPEAVCALVRDPTEEHAAVVRSLAATLAKYPWQASVKAALARRGLPIRPDVRAPLQPLPAEAADALADELQALT